MVLNPWYRLRNEQSALIDENSSLKIKFIDLLGILLTLHAIQSSSLDVEPHREIAIWLKLSNPVALSFFYLSFI